MAQKKRSCHDGRERDVNFCSVSGLLSNFFNSLSNFLNDLLDSSLSGNDRVESSLESLSVLLGELTNESHDSGAILSGSNGSNSLLNYFLNNLSLGSLSLLTTSASCEDGSSSEHKCNLFHFFAFLNL